MHIMNNILKSKLATVLAIAAICQITVNAKADCSDLLKKHEIEKSNFPFQISLFDQSVPKEEYQAPIKIGATWTWNADTVMTEGNSFEIPESGKYTLTLVANDGSTKEYLLNLSKGQVFYLDFSNNSISFSGEDIYAEIHAEKKPISEASISLKLREFSVEFTEQPQEEITEKSGVDITIHALAKSKNEEISYQWYLTPDDTIENAHPIKGATRPNFAFTTDLRQNGMALFCVATSGSVESISHFCKINICSAPNMPPVLSINGSSDLDRLDGVKLIHNPKYCASISPQSSMPGAGSQKLRISTDGGKTWEEDVKPGKSFVYRTETEGALHVIAEAYNSLIPELCCRSDIVLDVDNKAPVIQIDGIEPGWTNASKQSPTITITDNGIGLDEKPISWDGGKNWTTANSITVYGNSAYTLCVRDKGGNIRSQTLDLNNFDRVRPRLIVSGNSYQWTNNITLTIDASDKDSGLADNPYSWDGGETWTNAASKEVVQNEILHVAVKDKAGNTAKQDVYVTHFDDTAPIVKVDGIPSGWENQPYSLSVSATDDISGIHWTPYSWDGGKTWTSNNQYVIQPENTATSVEIMVRDVAGNIATQSIEFSSVDTTLPSKAQISGNAIQWQKDPVIIKATDVTDVGSGLDDKPFNWNNQGWTDNPRFKTSSNMDIELKIRDKAGNIQQQIISIDKIDTEKPEILSIEKKYVSQEKNVMEVTVNAIDSKAAIHELEYSFDDGVTWQKNNSKQFNTTQGVGIKVRDTAGNISYQPIYIQIPEATNR